MFQVETPGWAKSVLPIAAIFFALNVRAQFSTEAIDPANFPDHYSLGETKVASEDLLIAAIEPLSMASMPALIALTDFVRHTSPPPAAPEKYNRKNHFGSWRTDMSNCLDVRGRVLTRDSLDPVTTHQSGERCVVDTGRWQDPYSGNIQTSPRDVQIDHMVPLKNAYVMGGFGWSKNKKCWYANFLPANYHLIPVSSHENQAKSDKTPADYIPPNRAHQCDYVKNWLKIKMAWGLKLVDPEVDAIKDVIKQNGCKAKELAISADELKLVRAEMTAIPDLCK